MRLGVICARGGSKRIPKKNIRDFAGRPIMGWSVDAARASGCFDRLIVSTDDAEIVTVAESLGLEVPFQRPSELANDHAGTIEVMAHAVAWAKSEGLELDAVACLYPAAPFMLSADLVSALDVLLAGDWAYVFPATEFPAPIHRAFEKSLQGNLSMFFPEHFPARSQDLPVALHDAGQFYWGRPQAWLNRVPMIGPESTALTIPRWRVQDIDTPEDWAEAEQRWAWLNR